MTPAATDQAATLVDRLRAQGDPETRAELSTRYGIETEDAAGIPMRRLKAIAKPLAPDHDLAADLWSTGLYEARTIAAFVDDPECVDADQMDSWCDDFDNWAIVDTVCFHLFDKSPDAWTRVEPWARASQEFARRAGFALVWALALHDTTAPDERFRTALGLVEEAATDDRPLVTKAQTMALRAIAAKRPKVRSDVVALAQRLVDTGDPNARRVGRPIVKAFGADES